MQTGKYNRLTNDEQEEISRSLAQGNGGPEIAQLLGRDRITIWREIKRNTGKTGYCAFSASKRAEARAGSRRKGKRKLMKNRDLAVYVEDKLRQKWSPREISQRLIIEYAMDMSMQISHEAIYQYIYVLPRGELKRTLTKALRQEHKYRHQRKKAETQRKHVARLPICSQLKNDQQKLQIELCQDTGKVI